QKLSKALRATSSSSAARRGAVRSRPRASRTRRWKYASQSFCAADGSPALSRPIQCVTEPVEVINVLSVRSSGEGPRAGLKGALRRGGAHAPFGGPATRAGHPGALLVRIRPRAGKPQGCDVASNVTSEENQENPYPPQSCSARRTPWAFQGRGERGSRT